MELDVLPTRTAGAAENMAIDFLLLQRYPGPVAVRFRHYEWRLPAFTFGYAQKLAFAQQQLPPGERFDLCRRPTGGGVVDHRDDWTYALVIPRGHPLEEVRATNSYRAVHEALAGALRQQGVGAKTQMTAPVADDTPGGVCFERAEIYDVINEQTGAKIAGAAQKRNKHGLLFQGSVWRPACAQLVDWESFGDTFVRELAAALSVEAREKPWPDLNEEELSALSEQYGSPDWLGLR